MGVALQGASCESFSDGALAPGMAFGGLALLGKGGLVARCFTSSIDLGLLHIMYVLHCAFYYC